MMSTDSGDGLHWPCWLPEDGYVRLSLDAMLEICLEHLMSAVEGEQLSPAQCGTSTIICGYSEWASQSTPRLSLGWDWHLTSARGGVGLVRVGLPRSNVMLVDRHGIDYGWQRNLDALGTVVDALPWREDTERSIALGSLSVPSMTW